jgi:uncharacterized protein (TIRG00374 family)
MKKKLILGIIGIILFIYVFVVFEFDWFVLLQSKHPEFIVVSLICFLLSIVLTSFRMRFFLKALDEKHNFVSRLVKIEFINKFFYYVFPARLNVPAKAVLINKMLGASKGNSISITTFEYVLDVGIMFVFGLIGLSIFFQNFFDAITIENIVLTLVGLFVLVIVFFIIPMRIFDKFNKKLKAIKSKFIGRVFFFCWRIIFRIRENWPKILFNKQLLPAVILLVISWLLMALATEFVFIAYYSYVPFLWVLTVSVVAVLISGLSQIPGGLGLREITLVLLFVFLGVPESMAILAALIARIFTLVPILLGYLFFMQFGEGIKFREILK